MLNKIFLILLTAAVLFMTALSYLTNSQLKSFGFPPPQIVEKFNSFEHLHWISIWLISLVLLILGNIIIWTSRKSWALWLAFSFFAVFIMVNTWWLTENLAAYQNANNLATGGLLGKNGIFGAIFCIVGGIGIFFNQFIMFRLRNKMLNPTDENNQIVEESVFIEDSPAESKSE